MQGYEHRICNFNRSRYSSGRIGSGWSNSGRMIRIWDTGICIRIMIRNLVKIVAIKIKWLWGRRQQATLLWSLIKTFRFIRALQSKKKDLKVYSHDLSLGLYTGTRYQHRTENRFRKYRGIPVSILNSTAIGISWSGHRQNTHKIRSEVGRASPQTRPELSDVTVRKETYVIAARLWAVLRFCSAAMLDRAAYR